MSDELKSVLICRTDSLAGLILSIPVLRTIRKRFPKRRIILLGNREAINIFDKEDYVDHILGFDPSSKVFDDNLVSKLISFNCDQALLLSYDTKVLKLLKKAKVKQIMGPAHSLSSMFFLNAWKKQNRTKALKHELEYNLDLLDLLGIEQKYFDKEYKITVSKFLRQKVLENLGIEGKKYIVINPNSKIITTNWRYSFYGELALRLIEDLGIDVFFVSSQDNKEIVSLLVEQTFNKANKFESTDLKMLSAFISEASVFISPNSDFLHLAVATNTPVIGIFSPLKPEGIKRWGPYNAISKMLAPEIQCSEINGCKNDKCSKYLCMDTLSIDSIFSATSAILYRQELPKDLGF